MQLLKLRYLQLKRDLGYWVLIIAILVFFIVKGISEVSQLYTLSLTAVVLFFFYAYHSNRKDLNFINKYIDQPKKNLCFNYNLSVLPVSSALVFNNYWLLALGLHLGITLLVFIELKPGGPKLVFIQRYIPKAQFEWIAGLRKNLFIILPLLLIAVFLSPVKFFSVVALFVLNTVFLGFYNFFEPLVMLNPEGLETKEFLQKKVSFFTKVLILLNAPLLITNSFFHPDIAWFDACFLAGFLLIACCSVYIKYENYKPNDEIRFHIDSLLLFASAIVPFLLPIAFFLNSSHKKKAIQNLSHYIDDKS